MKFAVLLSFAVFVSLALAAGASGQDLPKPKLRLVSVSDAVNNGFAVKAYEIEVENREEFDNELFIPSPALPPCGSNTNASRTWISVYNERGGRLFGLCAVNSSGELASIRFMIAADRPQPRKIFIDMEDRFEERIVRSNTVAVE